MAKKKLGEFSGNPRVEWLSTSGPDRRMQLCETFWYDDPDDLRWSAPEHSTIDGASIPEPLWSIVGPPFVGDYRNASVVHDIACDNAKTAAERKAADRMFYWACRRGGCSKTLALLLYIGVRIGAWVPKVRYWEPALPAPARKGRRRHYSRDEAELAAESIRGTFYEIKSDVEGLGGDADIDDVDPVVEGHLELKVRQAMVLPKLTSPPGGVAPTDAGGGGAARLRNRSESRGVRDP